MSIPNMLKVLRKLYKHNNCQHDKHSNARVYAEKILSDKELNLLADFGWKTNALESFTHHHDVLDKIEYLKADNGLTRQRCTDAFIAGIGGSYQRGRSVLSAYHKLHNLPTHSYHEKSQYHCCWVCGEKHGPHVIHDSYFQYCLYLGNNYTCTPSFAYLNLKHLVQTEPVKPTHQDKIVFNELLDLLRASPADESPTHFEKRLNESKLLSGDRVTKRGILDSLALVGILPNPHISHSLHKWNNYGDIILSENRLDKPGGHSEIEMPWAGWKGHLKVDENKVQAYFSEYLL